MSQMWPPGQKIPNKLAAVENMLSMLTSMLVALVKPTGPCQCSLLRVYTHSVTPGRLARAQSSFPCLEILL